MIGTILRSIFVDEAIASCSGRFGRCKSYSVGAGFRMLEFAVVSIIPTLISIYCNDTYKLFVSGVTTFFGMKCFARLVEAMNCYSINM